jgi:AcrR family transcriptional regulator
MVSSATSLKARRSAATRESVVAAGLRLFAERGVEGTSLDEVAKEAGITKGAIYWHFASKDALVTALLDRIREVWQQTVLAPVLAEADPRRKVDELFARYHAFFVEHGNPCLLLLRMQLEARSPEVTRVYEQTARFIAGLFEEGKAAGRFRAGVDSLRLAYLVLGAMGGAILQCRTNRALSLAALLEEARDAVLRHAEP